MISKDEWKVAHVMRRTCCTRETAVDYLDAEEWDAADAVISLDGDRNAVLKEHWHKTVKWCGDVEDRLKAAKQHALSQTADIDAMFRTIGDIIETSRATRLELNKLVTARKEAVREEILSEGKAALAKHVEGAR